MADIDKARRLFKKAGLAFPGIPLKFRARFRERGEWQYSTRPVKEGPYNLEDYTKEASRAGLRDYVLLSHSGHGSNSYAIQYYLVNGALRLFLHMGWGGAYMNNAKAASTIKKCFALSNQIVSAATEKNRIKKGQKLLIVGSDFYGSYWSPPGKPRTKIDGGLEPAKVLEDVLAWLKGTDVRSK